MARADWKYISVRNDTYSLLSKLKIHPKQSFDELLKNLAKAQGRKEN